MPGWSSDKNAVRLHGVCELVAHVVFPDCDVIFENAEISAPDTDCSEACVGNPAQLCGAPNRLSVYSSGTAAIFPAEVPSVGAWNGLGCFKYADQSSVNIATYSSFCSSQRLSVCSHSSRAY